MPDGASEGPSITAATAPASLRTVRMRWNGMAALPNAGAPALLRMPFSPSPLGGLNSTYRGFAGASTITFTMTGAPPSVVRLCTSSSSGAACADPKQVSAAIRKMTAHGPGRLRCKRIIRAVSHPEYAKLRFRNRRVQRCAQSQPQHHARIGRIDHAVVPQACAGVIRMALLFILLPDRLLERLFLFLAPCAALGFDA